MSLIDERRIYFDPKTISLRGVYQCHELTIPGVQMLGKYDHLTARAPLGPHRHPGHVEISLMVKGRQCYRVGGQAYWMKGGDQFVTFPDEVHDTADDPEEKGSLFWLILEAGKIGANWLFLTPYAAAALSRKLLELPSRHFRANPQSHLTLDRAFALLREPATRFRNFEIAHQITQYLFQTLEASRISAIPAVSQRIQSTLDFIAQHEDEWIDLPLLARQSGLSEPRFKARFRQEMGIPPGQYMVRRKVEQAKERLARGRAHVTDIAHDLGFSSSQYFATVFKRYAQQTPSHFIEHLNSPIIPRPGRKNRR